jgi:shikimate dehydrogenase
MITGKAKLAGVFGWPVSHSRSPQLHGFWLKQYGIDGAYVPLATPPERFAEALRALPALGFRGGNVTLPHKEQALGLVDRVELIARRIGAVNTVVVQPDGTLAGTNTDGFGFMENLQSALPGWRADQGPAVVLGAGGAARSILVALSDAGCPEIRLANRTRARAEELAEELGGPIVVQDWEQRGGALDGAALLVNSSSLGMQGQPPLEIALNALPQSAVVTDIVYVPLMTPLLIEAQQRGNRVVDGLGMLLHQARPGFEAWFGVAPQVTPELRASILQGM